MFFEGSSRGSLLASLQHRAYKKKVTVKENGEKKICFVLE
jgi:hypothetical protein